MSALPTGKSRGSDGLPGFPRRAGRIVALLPALTLAACGLPRWPVEGPVTSPFGVRWRSTLPEIHRGVDIAVPSGTPVRSISGGVVRFAGSLGSYGTVVFVDHRGSVTSVYAHLSEARVRTGQRVDAGDVVGLSGRSGSATGPHLHFEVLLAGRAWNPVPLLGGRP